MEWQIEQEARRKASIRRSFMAGWSTVFRVYMAMTPEDQQKVKDLTISFDELMMDGGLSQDVLNQLITLFGLDT